MAEYFDHTTNARNDEKILDMRIELGAAGYGVWWMLLEKLAAEKDHMLEMNPKRLAWDLREDEELIRKVIMDYGLFKTRLDEETGKEVFWNERMDSRMAHIEGVRKAKSEAGRASGEARRRMRVETGTDTQGTVAEPAGEAAGTVTKEQTMNGCSTNSEQPMNIEDKIREDKNKEKKKEKKKSSSSILPGGEETESGAAEAAEEEEDLMEVDYWELTAKAQVAAKVTGFRPKVNDGDMFLLWKLARWLTTPKEEDRTTLANILKELNGQGRTQQELMHAMEMADKKRAINPIPLPCWNAIHYVWNVVPSNDRSKIREAVGRSKRRWHDLVEAVNECQGNAKIRQPGRFVLSRVTG